MHIPCGAFITQKGDNPDSEWKGHVIWEMMGFPGPDTSSPGTPWDLWYTFYGKRLRFESSPSLQNKAKPEQYLESSVKGIVELELTTCVLNDMIKVWWKIKKRTSKENLDISLYASQWNKMPFETTKFLANTEFFLVFSLIFNYNFSCRLEISNYVCCTHLFPSPQ